MKKDDENINESTGKTEENTSDQTDTENKCSVENGSENEKKYVNTKDLETTDKEEDKKSGEVLEEVELHKKSEDGRQLINEEECKENVEDLGVDSEDKKQKKVCFDLDENDMENDREFVKIQVEVGQVVKTVIGMEEDNDHDKNKIDDFYVNFPSSQTRFSEHMADLDNKMKTLEQEKYQVDAEDISDVEEGNETNTEEIVEVEKQEKEEEGEIRKDEELEKKDTGEEEIKSEIGETNSGEGEKTSEIGDNTSCEDKEHEKEGESDEDIHKKDTDTTRKSI